MLANEFVHTELFSRPCGGISEEEDLLILRLEVS